MEIVTDYDIGDIVWAGEFVKEAGKEACSVCGGAGHIYFKGYKMMCPVHHCSGGSVYNAEGSWKLKERSLQIGEVQVKVGKTDSEIRYMCEETGVGSGTLWPEAQLFPSAKALHRRAEEIKQKGFPTDRMYVKVEEEV